jgi:hypothetical protein
MIRIKFISFFFMQKNEVPNGCALTFLQSSLYPYKHMLPKNTLSNANRASQAINIQNKKIRQINRAGKSSSKITRF